MLNIREVYLYMKKQVLKRILYLSILITILIVFCMSGCSSVQTRKMTVTAYCGCGKCNSYEHGRWLYLKMNFWNRYISEGKHKGEKYTGKTARGTKLKEYDVGFFSFRNVVRPWMIPVRIVLFPWMFMPQKGTIAADTKYYPFGTEMYIPGYGWGVVEDRGGAIKGPNRIDIYFSSHGETEEWGKQTLDVDIYIEE